MVREIRGGNCIPCLQTVTKKEVIATTKTRKGEKRGGP